MSRHPSVPRDEVLRRMRGAFRANGYDGATMANLSMSTGLAKAALYHHFPGGKEEMGAAVLEDLGGWTRERVLGPLRGPEPAPERIALMVAALDELYRGGHEPCLIGLFSVGHALEVFSAQLEGAIVDLIAALGGALTEAGLSAQVAEERAEDAVMRIQGALVVSRALRDTAPFQRMLRRLGDQLLARS